MDREIKEKRKRNHRDRANFLSKYTFAFTLGLFKKALKKDLDDVNLYEVAESCEANKLGDRLEEEWIKQRKHNKNASIYNLLWARFGVQYLLLGLPYFAFTMFHSIMEPEAMSAFISYFSSSTENQTTKSEAIKTSFCSLIYRKALKLSPASYLDISLGNIVTLVTKDVQTFESSIWLPNEMCVAFIQTIMVCFLIYLKMGVTSLIGLGVFFVGLPLQIYCGKVVGRMRLKVNKNTDTRLQTTQEVLSAIKTIKLYVWEKFFEAKISKARKKEVTNILKIFYLRNFIIMTGVITSRLGFYTLIMVYIYMGNIASPELIFYVFRQFLTISHSVGVDIPAGLTQYAEFRAALLRINRILVAEELKETTDQDEIGNIENPKIDLRHVSVHIKDCEAIKNVTLTIEPGLTVITGSLGCGKSSLLKTILQDYPKTKGDVTVNGRISYAPQDPWLFPATIKQNILFGQDYDMERYNEVVKVCALELDFALLEQRDETIVADRGLNLSKGQQARINLARAVYKDSEIYLLDDSLTALDPHVQKYIFRQCIQGYLKKKECICVLVTHNPKHIEASNKLIVLQNGSIKLCGESKDVIKEEILKTIEKSFETPQAVEPLIEKPITEKTKLLEVNGPFKKNVFYEKKKQGGINLQVYNKYTQFGGGMLIFIGILCIFTGSQFIESYASKMLSKWVDLQQNMITFRITNTTNSTAYLKTKEINDWTLNVYSISIISSTGLQITKFFIFLLFATRASFRIHKKMISSIVGSTMSFFDSYFIGNILNRFSQDMNVVDEDMPYVFAHFIRILFKIAGHVYIITSVSLKFAIMETVLFVIMVTLRFIYIPAGRSLRRLEAASRSPMIGHLNSSLEGITTIRAYKAQHILKVEFDRHQDMYTSAHYVSFCMKKGFAFATEAFAKMFYIFVIAKFLYFDNDTSAGNVGLGITECMTLSFSVQIALAYWSELENMMTSVERLLEYTDLPKEYKVGQIIANWPTDASISFEKVSLTYPNANKAVLRNINFSLAPRSKVGIVGRTGAGKSTIIATLFRLYNFEGKIIIDGVDTKTLSLDFLRDHISIISQDPVLFSGTIRENMDPKNRYSDEEIWKALESVYMRDAITDLALRVNENDSSFSTGQRQLICIARAILRKNKIVVLDEATANMDPETENLIQNTIEQNFNYCAVFIIAHRLQSVMNCDRVIVLDRGEIIEFDDPTILLKKKEGQFYNMVKEIGLLDSLE
ncbi:unnamed protein product [Brassicogethes aeneus]|uniref:Uncharacterized protein n=1 Tax=Brassicogethes aeneus TaxID=1431903 RepID=A0A9P0FN50_BRAAE|nr:unnamed protein product [Brassicogethes aeneus]